MRIKLIALDLDGTTLNKKSQLNPATKETLEEAIRQGIHVVVATGRTYTALPQEIFGINGLEYIITSNGAYITRLADSRVIYTNYPDPDAMEGVCQILRGQMEFPIEVFTQGRAYIDKAVYEEIQAVGSDYMDASYIIRTRTPVKGIYDFLLDHKDSIENINIHFRSFDDKAKMKEVLDCLQGITVTSSMPHNLEIGGETTSKATALRSLCQILDIEEQDIMAVGDSPNDEAMIRDAGLGVAMGNAEESVKKMADFVTLTNEEDGVAEAVKKLVLTKK